MIYKPGMLLKSNTSGIVIKLVSRKNGNGHWNSMKICFGCTWIRKAQENDTL